MDLKIVIPNRNGGKFIEECLRHTLESARASGLAYQVIVVDNNSYDGSPDTIRKHFPEIEVVDSVPPREFSASNNFGAMQGSRAEYLLFINSDAYPVENALKVQVDFLRDHEDYVAAGPLQVRVDGTVVQTSWKCYTPYRILFFECILWVIPGWLKSSFFRLADICKRYSWNIAFRNRVVDVEWLSGFCLLAKTTAFEMSGGWDEDYPFYCEDMDLCYRFRKAGGKLAFLPNEKAIHILSASSTTCDVTRMQLDINAKVLFMQKHFPKYLPWLLIIFRWGARMAKGKVSSTRLRYWVSVLERQVINRGVSEDT